MAVGGVVVAEDAKHAVDGYTRDVVGDEDYGLLKVFVGVVRVCFSEDYIDFAAGVADT